jgi:hypothetical protein
MGESAIWSLSPRVTGPKTRSDRGVGWALVHALRENRFRASLVIGAYLAPDRGLARSDHRGARRSRREVPTIREAASVERTALRSSTAAARSCSIRPLMPATNDALDVHPYWKGAEERLNFGASCGSARLHPPCPVGSARLAHGWRLGERSWSFSQAGEAQ